MRVLLRIVSKNFVSTPDSRVRAMRPVRAISSTPAAAATQHDQRMLSAHANTPQAFGASTSLVTQ
jgi:hypothetical protein